MLCACWYYRLIRCKITLWHLTFGTNRTGQHSSPLSITCLLAQGDILNIEITSSDWIRYFEESIHLFIYFSETTLYSGYHICYKQAPSWNVLQGTLNWKQTKNTPHPMILLLCLFCQLLIIIKLNHILKHYTFFLYYLTYLIMILHTKGKMWKVR